MSMLVKPARARRPSVLAADRTPFEELEPIPNTVAMDAWGGWKGEGIGPGRSLYMSSGTRGGEPNDGGGVSELFRWDEGADTWVAEEIPTGAETMGKMRNTASTLYAFFESPASGQTWIISKSLTHAGSGGWAFEGVPAHGVPVGGRGLALNGPEGERVLGGASQNWAIGGPYDAEVYEKTGGGWDIHRKVSPSLMWELEFDGEGRLWEFFIDFDREHEAVVYVGGEAKGPPPERNIADACWYKGQMYVIGNLSFPEVANRIYRSPDGSEWEHVHTLEVAQNGDHVHVIPRGGEDGELWYTGHGPFEAGWFDGETWTREESVPEINTSKDTNHRTAIAYYGPETDDEQDRGVWLFARDAESDSTRVFRDRGAGGVLVLQVV